MKKFCLLFIVSFSFFMGFAQDVITTFKGKELKVKILEDWSREYTYIKYNDSDLTHYRIINKEDIIMIRFESGKTLIFFSGNEYNITGSPDMDSFIMLTRGRIDAQKYYRGYKKAQYATFLCSGFATPLVGLIPATTFSTMPLNKNHFRMPDTSLINNPGYYTGYQLRAYEMKHKKVWLGWSFGIFINSGILLMVIFSQSLE